MEGEAAANSSILLYLAMSGSLCFGTLVLLYNAYVLVQHLRAETTEVASGLSKAAWGLSVASFFIPPCGLFMAIVAWFMGRHEQLRVMNEESSPMSLGPAQMASMNGLVMILLSAVLFFAGVFTIWA